MEINGKNTLKIIKKSSKINIFSYDFTIEFFDFHKFHYFIKSWTLMVKSYEKMLIFHHFNEILMILMKMMEFNGKTILKNVNFSSNFDKKS